MKKSSKMLTKVTSLLLAIVLSLAPLSVQPCPMGGGWDQKVDRSPNTCCCCANSSATPLTSDNAEQHQCPCKMTEKQPKERSPAVVVSRYDSKPETFLVTLEIEPISEYCSPKLIVLPPHTFLLPSRDRPLYLLHSTLLI
jgi:hypothetical protein